MALFAAFTPSLAPDIHAAIAADAPKPTMPTFKWKWWYSSDRLDARSVIWSLENRPEEWEMPSYSSISVQHKPSAHRFSIYGGMSADCGCSQLRFQWGQRKRLGKAVTAFIRRQNTITQHQFQNHFLGQ